MVLTMISEPSGPSMCEENEAAEMEMETEVEVEMIKNGGKENMRKVVVIMTISIWCHPFVAVLHCHHFSRNHASRNR